MTVAIDGSYMMRNSGDLTLIVRRMKGLVAAAAGPC
jgi:hypothetical protein